MEPRHVECKQYGANIEQPYNKQGGGRTKIFCSHRCSSLNWIRDKKKKEKKSGQKRDAKPKSKSRKKSIAQRRKDWNRYKQEYKLLSRARTRANEKGLEFSLKLSDIKIPEKCPLLNIPFSLGQKKATPNSPSLDRINPTKGYTPDNIWVISHKANTVKSDLTMQEIKKLVENLEIALISQRIHEGRRDEE